MTFMSDFFAALFSQLSALSYTSWNDCNLPSSHVSAVWLRSHTQTAELTRWGSVQICRSQPVWKRFSRDHLWRGRLNHDWCVSASQKDLSRSTCWPGFSLLYHIWQPTVKGSRASVSTTCCTMCVLVIAIVIPTVLAKVKSLGLALSYMYDE